MYNRYYMESYDSKSSSNKDERASRHCCHSLINWRERELQTVVQPVMNSCTKESMARGELLGCGL